MAEIEPLEAFKVKRLFLVFHSFFDAFLINVVENGGGPGGGGSDLNNLNAIRDGLFEKLWRGVVSKVLKKSYTGKLQENNSCTMSNPENNSCADLNSNPFPKRKKKICSRYCVGYLNKKIEQVENSPPPRTFALVWS